VSPTPEPLVTATWAEPSAATKMMWLTVFGFWTVTIAIPWALVLGHVIGHHDGADSHKAFGYLTALMVLTGFTWLLILSGGKLNTLFLGKDKRVSTSKVQVLIWTYAIGGVLMAIVAQNWVGFHDGLKALESPDFNFEPYLVLLGGPFLAAIAASALVGTQVANGQTAKPPGEPEANQLFSGDDGNTDLVDSQYLLFNLIALAFFLGAYITDPGGGFPTIPTFVYILTGVSALAYVSNKVVPSGPPKINSIIPSTLPATGGDLTLYGTQLLFQRDPPDATVPGNLGTYQTLKVLVGGIPITPTAVNSGNGVDEINLTVPEETLTAGQNVKVAAINFRGTESVAVELKVSS
jgi:hypothetical protein